MSVFLIKWHVKLTYHLKLQVVVSSFLADILYQPLGQSPFFFTHERLPRIFPFAELFCQPIFELGGGLSQSLTSLPREGLNISKIFGFWECIFLFVVISIFNCSPSTWWGWDVFGNGFLLKNIWFFRPPWWVFTRSFWRWLIFSNKNFSPFFIAVFGSWYMMAQSSLQLEGLAAELAPVYWTVWSHHQLGNQ